MLVVPVINFDVFFASFNSRVSIMNILCIILFVVIPSRYLEARLIFAGSGILSLDAFQC